MKCLRRFTSRRGKCSILNSDNGTCFQGANREILEAYNFFHNQEVNEQIKELCASNGITWKFIPARSAHIGGLWEPTVKSFKYHFKRIASNQHFSYEEFDTLL
jgi:hypothetical protein